MNIERNFPYSSFSLQVEAVMTAMRNQ